MQETKQRDEVFFNLNPVDPSWRPHLQQALQLMDPDYLMQLARDKNWLPGPDKIFNAFSLPLHQVQYVLFGESPYPRAASANGYAFWDAAVQQLWSEKGLSKQVNRATSLRNIIKMLLVAEGMLSPANTSPAEIMTINKQHLTQTNDELFQNLQRHGFLLLNASLVLQAGPPVKDAKAWMPFIECIIITLVKERKHVKFILFGQIASKIEKIIQTFKVDKLLAEHPYNLSFIQNKEILSFFRPFHLLHRG